MENPTILIDDVAFGGDGVGRMPDGRVVFVPYTTIGDRVRVQVMRSQKRFVRAEIDEVVEAAQSRVTPACPFYTRCDGCKYQHIASTDAVDLKIKQLRGLLQRVGSLGAIPDIDPIVASPSAYGYRNKLKVHKADHGFGFYRADNKTVLPITSCAIAAPAINAAFATLDAAATTNTLRLDATGTVHRFTGGETTATRITERLDEGELAVPLTGFFQVNPEVGRSLVTWVRSYFADYSTSSVVDLYAGVGAFALALGDLAERVRAVESDVAAVAAAGDNARAWGLSNIDIIADSVEAAVPAVFAGLSPETTTVVIDPPRTGCRPQVLDAIRTFGPEQIIYVSCNAATLARDLKALTAEAGYCVKRLAFFDMFPQTTHFETVAVLSKA